jgi:rhodanese-related sulfurtransferase
LRRVLFYSGEFVIVNYKKIFGIIIISSILGLAINYLNPSGISLIREKKELKWAPDSLFIEPSTDSSFKPIDSTKILVGSSENEKNKTEPTKKLKNKEGSNEVVKETQIKNQKETKIKSETSTFTEPQAIKLSQAYSLFKKGVLFVDARDESDYLVGHITGSINIPFEDFDNYKQKLDQLPKEKPMVIYCAGTECDLSPLLANLLFERGYQQLYVFFGGWVEWQEANYPIEHQSETIKNE